jgi:hypothetical protein
MLFCIYGSNIIKKKPTELIQVGFYYVLKKTGLFFNWLWLYHQNITLVELVPFLVLTSTPSVPTLIVPSGFSSAAELL